MGKVKRGFKNVIVYRVIIMYQSPMGKVKLIVRSKKLAPAGEQLYQSPMGKVKPKSSRI